MRQQHLKTNWTLNSATSLIYCGVDHRIPLPIPSIFNSVIFSCGQRKTKESTPGLLCQKTLEIQAHLQIFWFRTFSCLVEGLNTTDNLKNQHKLSFFLPHFPQTLWLVLIFWPHIVLLNTRCFHQWGLKTLGFLFDLVFSICYNVSLYLDLSFFIHLVWVSLVPVWTIAMDSSSKSPFL